ncbi:hypothetical protein SSX86_032946 [Deinandra increscens subsp. villosa]|uniref:Transposase n=1 Tax=Deinandra increscens subsp. villosa TaxID=3103831 RepID=A0AAP0GGH1_9ASTR
MSDVSCNGPLLYNEDQYIDLHSPFQSANPETMETNPNVVNLEEGNEALNDATDGVHDANGTTTHLNRHLKFCPNLTAATKGQLKLNLQPGKSDSSAVVQNWKFDNSRIREVISHMIMVHDLPFNFVEYDLFNVMMKEANPAFNKISHSSTRQDCISSYDIGQKRIQKLLNMVNRVSITTDMWTSIQNIHYVVVTCHFVDAEFKLHKYILSFVDVPPPYSGVHIYDCLFKCLKEWNIETKVATLTVDNATTNDVVARSLKESLDLECKLAIDGKLFHVRCYAHILNLLVQDGLLQIKDVIHNVRESVKHVTASPGQLHLFGELSRQLKKPNKYLILDVSTRWNATYAMLSTALEFKDVFVNYKARESSYKTLPSEDDWKKVEDVCLFLELFNEATKIISGSEYPTSNLFLAELYGIKELVDHVASNENDCMKSMADEMKKKFDKIYTEAKKMEEIAVVKFHLEELFKEYVKAYKEPIASSSRSGDVDPSVSGSGGASTSIASRFRKCMKTGTAKFDQHIRSVGCVESVKSELAIYLDEGVCIPKEGEVFDALGWWKDNKLKYRILSKMAADILAIPITIVASESAFSAGGRVIDPHRSALGTKMVDMLICGADWYQHYYGLQKKEKEGK